MKRQRNELDEIQLSLFCKELGMLFKGGVPLYDAFLIMEESTDHRRQKELYHKAALSREPR